MSAPVYSGHEKHAVLTAVTNLKQTFLDLARGAPENGRDMKAALEKLTGVEKDITTHFNKAESPAFTKEQAKK